MEKVYSEKAPAAIGPYSQAMKAGGLLFTSGQIPIDPATGAVAGEDITAQTEQVMQNLGAVLEAAGGVFLLIRILAGIPTVRGIVGLV